MAHERQVRSVKTGQSHGKRRDAVAASERPSADQDWRRDRSPDLETAPRAELSRLWTAFHGGSPPRSISQPLLRKILAFDVQLRAVGGWPAELEAKIERAGRETTRAVTPPLVATSRLLREWNGTTHVVDVTADGYFWQGRSWRSLSAIARAITGAHWSGPRFFGLTGGGHARNNGGSTAITRKSASTTPAASSSVRAKPNRPAGSASRPARKQTVHT